MAYRVLELRPDPALLNPRFDGYKLRLVDSDGRDEQQRAVQTYPLANLSSVEPQHIASNTLLAFNEVYSRIHYNHLSIGPRSNTVIYIDSERQVYLAEIRKRDAPRITRIFTIPLHANTYALSGYYGAYAVGENVVLVFDGAASVYVLQRVGADSPDTVDEHWVVSGVFEVGLGSVAAGAVADNERRTMYYILGAQLTNVDETPVIQIQVCYRETKEGGDDVFEGNGETTQSTSKTTPPSMRQRSPPMFCIQAMQVAVPAPSTAIPSSLGTGAKDADIPVLSVSTAHTLHTHAIPLYCEFVNNSQYVLGVKGGIVLDDTELATQPSDENMSAPNPSNLNPDPYYWTQTPSDVTVCIELPAVVSASQITCELTRSSLSLRFADSSECAAKCTFSDRQFCDRIIADESVWTLENGRLLTLYLQKEHEGARWATVFADDDGVLETIDANEFAVIRERLEKYTSSDVETGKAVALQPYVDQDSGGDPEQLDEAADVPVMFSVRSWRTGQAEASSVAGAPDWLCPAFPRAPRNQSSLPLPPICLKFDVDGVVFGFDASDDGLQMHTNVCARHAGTFSALSYIQAGKREKRFAYIDSDMAVAVLAETQRRVYIYHQAKRADAESAVQNVVDLGGSGDEAEILGIQLVDGILVVLRKHSLCLVDLSLC
ncbi:hypothetical protein GGF43_003480 [Coemansia sp. RSA 2618]|nr:hypothetical protein GGF43_003480 [Coemansia sp. RSA 2618]